MRAAVLCSGGGTRGKAGGNGFPWQFDHNIHFFATAQYLMNGSPVEESAFRYGGQLLVARRCPKVVPVARMCADDLYDVNTADDFPLITWTYDDPACQGVWMRAERCSMGD